MIIVHDCILPSGVLGSSRCTQRSQTMREVLYVYNYSRNLLCVHTIRIWCAMLRMHPPPLEAMDVGGVPSRQQAEQRNARSKHAAMPLARARIQNHTGSSLRDDHVGQVRLQQPVAAKRKRETRQ